MIRRRKLLFAMAIGIMSILAITSLLAVAVTAQNGDDDSRSSFADRVARILGLQSETVQDAFEQAKQEIETEERENYIDGMIQKGLLTEEEAAQLREEWDDISKFDLFDDDDHLFIFPRGRWHHWDEHELPELDRFHFRFGEGGISSIIDQLVEQGVISEEEAARLRQWSDQAPHFDFDFDFSNPEFEHRRFKFGRPFGFEFFDDLDDCETHEGESDDGNTFRFRMCEWEHHGYDDDYYRYDDDDDDDDYYYRYDDDGDDDDDDD